MRNGQIKIFIDIPYSTQMCCCCSCLYVYVYTSMYVSRYVPLSTHKRNNNGEAKNSCFINQGNGTKFLWLVESARGSSN